MLTSTETFLGPLEQWVKAVRADDFPTARHHAEHLIKAGQLLVIHPDFRRGFEEHCPGVDPHDALVQLCQFLICASDGRAVVLKQWVKDNRPKVA